MEESIFSGQLHVISEGLAVQEKRGPSNRSSNESVSRRQATQYVESEVVLPSLPEERRRQTSPRRHQTATLTWMLVLVLLPKQTVAWMLALAVPTIWLRSLLSMALLRTCKRPTRFLTAHYTFGIARIDRQVPT